MTKAGFGEHLKREREMRGVSLDEICAATRIDTRFLEALENEQWDRLPGGVFNRGFIRAVARYLGLDEDGMVAEYVMAINQGHALPAWAIPEEPQKKMRNWLPWFGLAMVFILAAAGWLGWRFYNGRSGAPAAAQRAAETVAETRSAIDLSPGPSEIPRPSPPLDIPASAVPYGAAPPSTDKLVLKIEAGKATTVAVTADGNNVFEGIMIPGQHRTFEAQDQFDVAAGAAGALVLQLNGRMLAPIGPPGSSGKVTLTRRDLREGAGGQN